jgi:hypothetical protein
LVIKKAILGRGTFPNLMEVSLMSFFQVCRQIVLVLAVIALSGISSARASAAPVCSAYCTARICEVSNPNHCTAFGLNAGQMADRLEDVYASTVEELSAACMKLAASAVRGNQFVRDVALYSRVPTRDFNYYAASHYYEYHAPASAKADCR